MPEVQSASEITNLLEEGNSALQAGNAYEARKLFRKVTELQPENVYAWIGLAHSVRPYKDKQEYFQQALARDPSNSSIQMFLQDVEQKLAAGEVFAAPIRKSSEEPDVTNASDSSDSHPDESTTPVTYCYRHAERETGLYCTQCAKPICAECAKPAAVGQLCPDCARERRPPNYQVSAGVLTLTGVVSFVISLVANILLLILTAMFLGKFFFGFLVALFLGSLLSNLFVRLLDRLTHAKRGKAMQLTVGFGLGLGAVPLLLLSQLPTLLLFTVVLIGITVAQLR
jgi:hypothetical protein